jgi:hypothetical protein
MASIDWPSDLADVLVSGYDIVEDGLDAWHSCNTWSCATEYPDGAGGTTYLQDAWATTDSWIAYQGDLTVSGGVLRTTQTSSTYTNCRRTLTELDSKMVRLRIRASGSFNVYVQVYTGSFKLIGPYAVTTAWSIIDVLQSYTGTNKVLYIQTAAVTAIGDWFEIDWIYIGTGICTNLLTDDSGNGIDCYVYGDTSVAGVSGNGLYRNGVNAYERSVNVLATVPDIWHYHEVIVGGSVQPVSTYHCFINYKSTSTSVGFMRLLRLDSTTLALGYCDGATSAGLYFASFFTGYSTASLTIDVMVNWITGVVNVYRNGVYFGTATMTTPVKPTAGSYIYFGSYQGTLYFAKGTFDERRLYSYAPSEPKVKYLYDNPTTYEAISASPLKDGYASLRENNMIRTKMDAGPAKQRRRYTAFVRYYNASFLVDAYQKQVLEQFYEDTCAAGTLDFNWTDPETAVVYDARFRAAPEYVAEGQDFMANCQFEVVP